MTVGRPRIPDEIKRARGTFKPSRAISNGALCEHLEKRYNKAKRLVPDNEFFLDAYHEILELIDANHEHVQGMHGVLSGAELDAVRLLEELTRQLLDSIGVTRAVYDELEMHYCRLCDLVNAQNAANQDLGPWDD
jgi:hypothetical protein